MFRISTHSVSLELIHRSCVIEFTCVASELFKAVDEPAEKATDDSSPKVTTEGAALITVA